MEIIDIRKECWDQAIRCFATAYIFERRANILRTRLRILTFIGIATPIVVGRLIISFGSTFPYANLILVIASLLIIAQLIMSAWSLVAKWDDSLAYATKSNSGNRDLSLRFKELGKNPPKAKSELNLRYQLLQTEYRNRSEEDEVQGVKDKEKRRGMRAGLREFQRPCATCGEVPKCMIPTNCGTCGNF